MPEYKKEKNNKYLVFLKNLPWLIGERLFLSIIVFILITVAVGGVVFYQYAIQAPKTEPESEGQAIRFQRDLFWDLVEIWEKKRQNFENAPQKEYNDFFLEG